MVAAGNGRASRLAQRLALGKPAISAAVESLTARGLLFRSALDPDRRATRLEITRQGLAALTAAEAAMSAELADLLAHAPDRPRALAGLESLSLAVDRRQAAREVGAAKQSPGADT
jgi:DNA-binding MarR family transcriptional regulator